MTRVLVTGATGFVGGTLCETLRVAGHPVRAAARSQHAIPRSGIEPIVVGDIGATTEWSAALQGIECVIHCAARAHVLNDSADHAHRYFETNTEGTRRLAQSAANAGVRRFVFVSSVKVNGEMTSSRPFTPADPPKPLDPYGMSKLAAEQALTQIAASSGMEVAIVRPPLVYGPGVRANFRRLMALVERQWPLPLGAVDDNRRSLVSVWNLCDLLQLLACDAPARSGVWMVSDGEDLSTAALIRRLAAAMRRRARLLPVPRRLLSLAGSLMHREAEVGRLCDSLAVDISATREILQWRPPITVDEGFARTTAWYLDEGRARET